MGSAMYQGLIFDSDFLLTATIGVLGFWGTVADDDAKKQGIVISEAWLAELEKHPFHSSKC
jgi:hypothetical protein